jgi:hypothetical protein
MTDFEQEHKDLVNEMTNKIMDRVVRPHVIWDSDTDSDALESIRQGMHGILYEIYCEALDVNNNVDKTLGL